MKWDFLRVDVLPKPPQARAGVVMASVGVLSGLISSIPSPLPDLRLDDPDVLISAETVPLHAGVAFGVGVAAMLWLWMQRDFGKCLLTMALTLIGWLAAVNTANDLYTVTVGSDVLGTAPGAKENREILAWLLAGIGGGAVGAGLTAFGAGIPAQAIRRPPAWVLIVVVGSLFGSLLYPAAKLDALALLFVPWQAAVAGAIAHGLTRA